jgi:hypothetical protein
MLRWQQDGLLLTNIYHFINEMGLYEPITERLSLVESCEHATMDELVFSHKSDLVWMQDLLGVVVDVGCDGWHL